MLILVALWLIILLAVGIDALMRKTGSRFISLDDEITINQAKLNRLKAVLKQEKELSAEYDNIFSNYRPIKDSDSLLQEIDSIAKKLNVNIINIKPGTVKQEPGFSSYAIRIDGQDDVYSVARFLNVLCEQIKGLSIERMQFSAQNRDELPKVSITVNALVFKQ